MELRHLKYFVAVAEEENVTKAAARLHVSQPPLSRQIRNLEDELGVQLFQRSAKSIHLTEAGRLFLPEAKAVLDRATQAAQAVKALGSGLAGQLDVGYAPSLAVDILPSALRRFQEEAPKIRVHLHDLSSQEMLAGVRANKLDLALMIEQPATALKGLHARELGSYKISVAVSPLHKLARQSQCQLGQVEHERLIGYSQEDYPEYRHWLQSLPWPGKQAPVISEEHDSVTSLIAAVEVGRGVAIVPDSLECLSGPRLKLLPIRPALQPSRVIAVWKSLPAKTNRFLQAALDVKPRHGLKNAQP